MDIDQMTPEQHVECMQKGLCFGCGKQGHLGKDCPDRAGTSKQTQTKKYNGNKLNQHIQSLLKDMNDEEIDEFWKESEAQGFYKGELPRRQSLLVLTSLMLVLLG